MPPWTSGLSSVTLRSVTQELPSVTRSEAFQRGGNGRLEIQEWFAAGKEWLGSPGGAHALPSALEISPFPHQLEDKGRKILGSLC